MHPCVPVSDHYQKLSQKGLKKDVDIGRRNFVFSFCLIVDNNSLMQNLTLEETRVKGTNGGRGYWSREFHRLAEHKKLRTMQ